MSSRRSPAGAGWLALAIVLGLTLGGPGGLAQPEPAGREAPLPPEELQVPEGYRVRMLVGGLDFPSAITWDENGTAYVATAGFAYGVNHTYPAQVMRLGEDGTREVIADGFDPPLTDVTWHDGSILVSERGQVTRLVHENGTWTKRVVVSGLPAFGDHHTNEVVVGPDGRIYFGQGTATNAAVVGLDNLLMAWQENVTAESDVPCEDVVLRGWNYVTDNPWRGERVIRHFQRAPTLVYEREADIPPEARGVEGDNVTTGAYVPFGTPTYRGQTVPGKLPCNGAILRVEANGTGLAWHAWGLRNPYALKFDAQGRLWVSENMYDTRGSRPIAGCPDHFWRVEEGRWYGWPDYCGSVPINRTAFSLPNETGAPQRLLLEDPSEAPVPSPALNVTEHAGATKFDFAPGMPWGGASTVYMAQFGDMTPMTGLPGEHAGMAVVRFDAEAPRAPTPFLVAKERFGGEFRPVEAIFGPGGSLYVVHIGAVPMREAPGAPVPAAPFPMAGTGAVYVVEPVPPGGGGADDPDAGGPGGGADGPPAETTGGEDDAAIPLPVIVLLAGAVVAALVATGRRR